MGNWYDVEGMEVHQGKDGDSDFYVTRGDRVVYLNRRRGGQSGMWRCDIPDRSGRMQSIYIYTGTTAFGLSIIIIQFFVCIHKGYLSILKIRDYTVQRFPLLVFTLHLIRVLLSSLSHVAVKEDQPQLWSGREMKL